MATRNERLQAIIQSYKLKTGNKTIDMDAVADWAIKQGVELPKPKSAKELFVEQLSDAARAEYRKDEKTGYSYRANHAIRVSNRKGQQMTLWVDIEDASRAQMLASLTNRRQQIVCDAVQLKTDEMIWNAKNPNDEPIQLVMDFTEDVEERLNSPGFGTGEVA